MSSVDNFLSLYRNDSCYLTYKAYAEYSAPLIDDYFQVTEFKAALDSLQRWQNCCPDGRLLIERARPQKTVLSSLEEIPAPPMFGSESPCYSSNFIETWKKYHATELQYHWREAFRGLRDQLHGCCTAQFNQCLKETAKTKPGAATEAATQCLKRFDPAHQPKTANPLASECDYRIAAAKTIWQQTSREVSPLPAASASVPELVAWGTVVLVAAFLIGAAGRQQKRLLAGGTGALIAGVVFFGSLMVLPASGRMGLLSATVSSLLLVTLRSLFRALYLLRHRRIPSP